MSLYCAIVVLIKLFVFRWRWSNKELLAYFKANINWLSELDVMIVLLMEAKGTNPCGVIGATAIFKRVNYSWYFVMLLCCVCTISVYVFLEILRISILIESITNHFKYARSIYLYFHFIYNITCICEIECKIYALFIHCLLRKENQLFKQD